MAVGQKDTVYIDVDDEITAIIEKVKDSSSKIVALVLPKRAAALQSIVNMKLLKRAAADADKNVVLITTETGILPLAGAVGMYVAKNLQTKPEIPDAPKTEPEADEDVAELDDDSKVGAVATGAAAGATAAALAKADDTLEMDDEEPAAKAAKPKKKKSGKTPKIPNFEKFRTKLFIGGAALILLIGLFYMMGFVWPSANITITTDTEDLNTSVEFTADTSATTVSAEDKIVPATEAEVKKEDSQKVDATGEEDQGKKATGSVTLSVDCGSGTPTVPAKTKLTAQGLTFLTNESVTVASFPDTSGGTCKFKKDVGVTAESKGANYNISATNYSVSGFSSVSAVGSAMTGGVSKIVKVVSQQDVDDAKAKLDTGEDAISAELEGKLQEQGVTPIKESLQKSDEKTDVSPAVGSEASEVTVSYSVTYTMIGVNPDDLTQVVSASVEDEIDTDRQQVQSAGLDQASYKVKGDKVTMNTIVGIGPKIDTEKLKSEIAGKKKGETEEIVRQFPGVNDVTVDYSPFWVNKTPKKASKVTIEFQDVAQ